jgi:hypothetical protein
MTGVLIILGIALAVAVGGFVLHALFHRFGRSRPEAIVRAVRRAGGAPRAASRAQDSPGGGGCGSGLIGSSGVSGPFGSGWGAGDGTGSGC